MNDYRQAMGIRIKTRRKQLLFTQEEIAERLGVSVKHFSEVERGLAGLSMENLIKLSDILGLSLDFIVKGEEDRCNWDSVLELLQSVPREKEQLIKELINLGIKLSRN